MCRGKGDPGGGRRCSGCANTKGLAKHNERRRNNRAIKKHVIAWAQAEGHSASDLAALEQAPPNVAKEWARARGVDPEKFIAGVPDDLIPGRPVPMSSPARPAVAGPVVVGPPAGVGGRHRATTPGVGGAGRRAAPSPPAGGHGAQARSWSTQSWCTEELRDQISVAMSQQGAHRDERALLDGDPEQIVTLKRSGPSSGASAAGSGPTGGTNTTRRIELSNGVTAYFKPFDGVREDIATDFGHDSSQQSLHEAAAWQLAREMGPPWSEVVPPVVIREVDGELGSCAVARPGKHMVMSPWHTGEWRQSAFFDSLIGQQDRHPGNYLVSGDRIALIDHGYTFASPGDYQNYTWLTGERSRREPGLSYEEQQVLRRLLASANLMGLQTMLQPARAAALKARAERMLSTNQVTTDY